MHREPIFLSISKPVFDFTNRLGSSHRNRLNQSAIPSQDRREKIPCDRHLRHLEAGVAEITSMKKTLNINRFHRPETAPEKPPLG